jgi:hypothetical protein
MNEIESRRQIQERMQEDAKAYIRSTGDFRAPDELAQLFGTGASAINWPQQLQIWKLEQRIFSIEDGGWELFPIYAFDLNFLPRKAVGEVLRILGSHYQDWGLASWFAGINSFLDDQAPKDLLPVDPSWVIEAAQDGLAELEGRL